MALHILALGSAGARMARSVLYAAMAGVMPDQTVHLTLLCPGDGNAEAAVRAFAELERVQLHTGSVATGCFSRRVSLDTWPEEQAAFSLNDQAVTETDQLLSRALFTREQASLAPERAMDAGYDVAAMSWAALLSGEATGALKTLMEDVQADPETPVVLMGSLCETVCAAGITALCSWLAKLAGAKPSASLLLPVYAGEDSGLCSRVLKTAALEERLRSLCLIGLPEDCRTTQPGGDHLCDWLAVHAAVRQLTGLTGSYTWRIQADQLTWSMFGEEQEAWRDGYETLMKLAYLFGAAYGDQLLQSLTAPNRLRDHMLPWYNAHFLGVRKLEEAQRQAMAEDAEALLRLLGGYVHWMREVQEHLPPMMRWADALRDVRKLAEIHYGGVLEAAGQHAWLANEINRSGMAHEHIVHRYDMRDTEAEAAMKKLDELADRVTDLSAKQDEMNHALGGRLTRSMLTAVAERCAREADDLRAQAEEGARRIRRAAEVAKVEEMAAVETARSRLERMERRVQLLDGRTKQARHDLERWSGNTLRHLPPVLTENDTASVGLYDDAWLALLDSWFAAEGKEARQQMNQLAENWPWPEQPMKQVTDRVARNEFPDPAVDQLGGFVLCLVRSLDA